MNGGFGLETPERSDSRLCVAHITLSEREFDLFRRLVREHSGITLGDAKRSLVASRLNKRLRRLQLSSFSDYYQIVRRDPKELVTMLDLITTNKTEFFRDPEQFEFLREEYIPDLIRRTAGSGGGTIRVWSAACSSGEEPYSIAMCFAEAFEKMEAVPAEIIATDLSSRMLVRAEAGIYEMARLDVLSREQLRKYFLKGTGSNEGMAQVKPCLKRMITFQRLNLHSSAYAFREPFDIVFCRNVLIYFAPEAQRSLLTRIRGWIRPGGLLFTGRSESLHALSHLFDFVRPSVYVRKGEDPEIRPLLSATAGTFQSGRESRIG